MSKVLSVSTCEKILLLVEQGFSYSQIGNELSINHSTIARIAILSTAASKKAAKNIGYKTSGRGRCRETAMNAVLRHIKNFSGCRVTDIANATSLPNKTVAEYLSSMLDRMQISYKIVGGDKCYYPAAKVTIADVMKALANARM